MNWYQKSKTQKHLSLKEFEKSLKLKKKWKEKNEKRKAKPFPPARNHYRLNP